MTVNNSEYYSEHLALRPTKTFLLSKIVKSRSFSNHSSQHIFPPPPHPQPQPHLYRFNAAHIHLILEEKKIYKCVVTTIQGRESTSFTYQKKMITDQKRKSATSQVLQFRFQRPKKQSLLNLLLSS